MGPWQRYGFVVAVCWLAHAVPNSTSGPHLAPYPLSRFSRAVPPRLVALLHAVSRFIRIFAPGDVTLSCLGEEGEGGKRGKEERERELRAESRNETRRGHEEREKGSTRDPRDCWRALSTVSKRARQNQERSARQKFLELILCPLPL